MAIPKEKRVTRERLRNIRQEVTRFRDFNKRYLRNHTREQEILNQTEEALQNYWEAITSGQAAGQPDSKLKQYEDAITQATSPFRVLDFHRLLHDKARTLLHTTKKASSDPNLWLDISENFKDIKETVASYTADSLVKAFYEDTPLKRKVYGYNKSIKLKVNTPEAATSSFKTNLDDLQDQLTRCVVAYYMECVYFLPQSERQKLEKKIVQCLALIQNLICMHQITLSGDNIADSVLAYKKGRNTPKTRGHVRKHIASFNNATQDYLASYDIIGSYPELHNNQKSLAVPLPTFNSESLKKKKASPTHKKIIKDLHDLQSNLLAGGLKNKRQKTAARKIVTGIKQDLKNLLGIKIHNDFFAIKIPQTTPRLKPNETYSIDEVKMLKKSIQNVFWSKEGINKFLEKHNVTDLSKITVRVPKADEKFFKITKPKGKPHIAVNGFLDIIYVTGEDENGEDIGKSLGVLEIVADLNFFRLDGSDFTNHELATFIIESSLKAAAESEVTAIDDNDPRKEKGFVTTLLLAIAKKLERAYVKNDHDYSGSVSLRFLGFDEPKEPETYNFDNNNSSKKIELPKQYLYVFIPIETRFEARKQYYDPTRDKYVPYNYPLIGAHINRIVQYGNQHGFLNAKIEIGKPNQTLSAELSLQTVEEMAKEQTRIIFDSKKGRWIKRTSASRKTADINVNITGDLVPAPNTAEKDEKRKQEILEILNTFFNIKDNKSLKTVELSPSENSKELGALIGKFAESNKLKKIEAAQGIVEFFCSILKKLGSTFKGEAHLKGTLLDSTEFKYDAELDLGTSKCSSIISNRLTAQSHDYIEIGDRKRGQSIILNLKNLQIDAGTHETSKIFPSEKQTVTSLSTNLEVDVNHAILETKFATVKCDFIGEITFKEPGKHLFNLTSAFDAKKKELNALFKEIKKEPDTKNLAVKGITKASVYYGLVEQIVAILKEEKANLLGRIILTFILPDNELNQIFTLTLQGDMGYGASDLGLFIVKLKHSNEKTKFKRINLLQYQLPETPLGGFLVRLNHIDFESSHQVGTHFRLYLKTLVSSLDHQKSFRVHSLIKGEMTHADNEHAAEILIKAFEANMKELQELFDATAAKVKTPSSLDQYVTKTSAFYKLGNKILDIIRSSKVAIKGYILFRIDDPKVKKTKAKGSLKIKGKPQFKRDTVYLRARFDTEKANSSLGVFAVKLDYKKSSTYYPLSKIPGLGSLYLRVNDLDVLAGSGNKPKFETQLRIGAFEDVSHPVPLIGAEIVMKGHLEHKNPKEDAKKHLINAFNVHSLALESLYSKVVKIRKKLRKKGTPKIPLKMLDSSKDIEKKYAIYRLLNNVAEILDKAGLRAKVNIDLSLGIRETDLIAKVNKNHPTLFKYRDPNSVAQINKNQSQTLFEPGAATHSLVLTTQLDTHADGIRKIGVPNPGIGALGFEFKYINPHVGVIESNNPQIMDGYYKTDKTIPNSIYYILDNQLTSTVLVRLDQVQTKLLVDNTPSLDMNLNLALVGPEADLFIGAGVIEPDREIGSVNISLHGSVLHPDPTIDAKHVIIEALYKKKAHLLHKLNAAFPGKSDGTVSQKTFDPKSFGDFVGDLRAILGPLGLQFNLSTDVQAKLHSRRLKIKFDTSKQIFTFVYTDPNPRLAISTEKKSAIVLGHLYCNVEKKTTVDKRRSQAANVNATLYMYEKSRQNVVQNNEEETTSEETTSEVTTPEITTPKETTPVIVEPSVTVPVETASEPKTKEGFSIKPVLDGLDGLARALKDHEKPASLDKLHTTDLNFNVDLYLHRHQQKKSYGTLKINFKVRFSHPKSASEGLNDIAKEINNRSQILQRLLQHFINQGLMDKIRGDFDYKDVTRLILQFIASCTRRAGCHLKGTFSVDYDGETPYIGSLVKDSMFRDFIVEVIDRIRPHALNVPTQIFFGQDLDDIRFDTKKPKPFQAPDKISEQARRLFMWTVILKTMAALGTGLGKNNLTEWNVNQQGQTLPTQVMITAKKTFEELDKTRWHDFLILNLEQLAFPGPSNFLSDEMKKLEQGLIDSYKSFIGASRIGVRGWYHWMRRMEIILSILSQQKPWSDHINLKHVNVGLPPLYATLQDQKDLNEITFKRQQALANPKPSDSLIRLKKECDARRKEYEAILREKRDRLYNPHGTPFIPAQIRKDYVPPRQDKHKKWHSIHDEYRLSQKKERYEEAKENYENALARERKREIIVDVEGMKSYIATLILGFKYTKREFLKLYDHKTSLPPEPENKRNDLRVYKQDGVSYLHDPTTAIKKPKGPAHLVTLRGIEKQIDYSGPFNADYDYNDHIESLYHSYVVPNVERFLHYLCSVQAIFFDEKEIVTTSAIREAAKQLSKDQEGSFWSSGTKAVILPSSNEDYLESLDSYLQTMWKKLDSKLATNSPEENTKALKAFTAFLKSSSFYLFFIHEEHQKLTTQQLSNIRIWEKLQKRGDVGRVSRHILTPAILYQRYIFEGFRRKRGQEVGLFDTYLYIQRKREEKQAKEWKLSVDRAQPQSCISGIAPSTITAYKKSKFRTIDISESSISNGILNGTLNGIFTESDLNEFTKSIMDSLPTLDEDE